MPAWAEWSYVASSYEENFYINYSTIRQEGDSRKVWELVDLNKKGIDGEMSFVNKMEYECKEEARRPFAWIKRDGPMGTGKTLSNGDFAKSFSTWVALPPGSIGISILKKICAR